MKNLFSSGVIALAVGATLTGCQAETTESGLPTDFDFQETQEQAEPIDVISVWAPSSVASSLTGISSVFESEYGVEIQFTEIELAEIDSRLQTGNYPDVFFGTHSWTADLAESEAVSKLRTGILGDKIPEQLLEAFSYQGDSFGVPISEQHVALVCNSELVPEQPSIDDLQEIGLGVGLDSELGDPYHLYPFMSSFGLSLSDPQNTEFDSDSGYEYASWMSSQGSELFDLNSDYTSVLEAFNSEQIGCWLTGPWAIASIEPELMESLVIYPVPAAGNVDSSALVDVAGFFVAANSDDPVYANRLVLEYFTRNTSQVAVAKSLSGVPAVETDDELFSMFRESVINATPTPSSELMDQLWPLLGATQADLIRNDISSEEIWSGFVSELNALRSNQD